jgi:hypothetical protein
MKRPRGPRPRVGRRPIQKALPATEAARMSAAMAMIAVFVSILFRSCLPVASDRSTRRRHRTARRADAQTCR